LDECGASTRCGPLQQRHCRPCPSVRLTAGAVTRGDRDNPNPCVYLTRERVRVRDRRGKQGAAHFPLACRLRGDGAIHAAISTKRRRSFSLSPTRIVSR
jgi:hypothetical protein